MAKTYSKLRGRIVEVYGSQRAFGKQLKLSEQSITAKLNGRTEFSQDDIVKWCNLLGIEAKEVGDYFFTQ